MLLKPVNIKPAESQKLSKQAIYILFTFLFFDEDFPVITATVWLKEDKALLKRNRNACFRLQNHLIWEFSQLNFKTMKTVK